PEAARQAARAWPSPALHQVEENTLAHTPVGDTQATDGPSRTDRVEDGTAAQHQISTLAADAGIGRAAVKVEPGEIGRNGRDLLEGQHAAVDERANIAR